jgi:predicted DNA-binding protein (UPF0251 family)
MDEIVAKRFWSKVTKGDGCWKWTGAMSNGYGSFAIQRRSRGAHRLSWEMKFGRIPDGLYVCHRCDNPPCVRPDHLFLGTAKDNNVDMVKKRRNGPVTRPDRFRCKSIIRPVGEQQGASKLTDEAVRQIRLLSDAGYQQKEIALRFGVHPSAVSKVLRHETWRHVA